MQWLRHAFAVDAIDEEPSNAEQQVVESLCRGIVRRHLSAPALAFLEMSRPLNYFGAQALYVLAPFLSVLTSSSGHRHLAEFLERRDSVDRLCRRIEALEAEAVKQEAET